MHRNGRLAGALVLIAMGASAASAQPTADSLYARLGGTIVVSAFVADTIDKVIADPEMKPSFDRANLQHVKALLTERICTLTGGGCTDHGVAMRELHSRELIEAMRESMRAHDVPLVARNQLLEILAPMSRDVAKL
jgi:hemoglobin